MRESRATTEWIQVFLLAVLVVTVLSVLFAI